MLYLVITTSERLSKERPEDRDEWTRKQVGDRRKATKKGGIKMEKYESGDCTVDLRWMVQGKEREVTVTFSDDEDERGNDDPYLIKVEIELADYSLLDISDLFSYEEGKRMAFSALTVWRTIQADLQKHEEVPYD